MDPRHAIPAGAQRRHDEGVRFLRRMYLPRTLGLALGGACIAPVLWANGAHPALWAALIASALVWPHVAYRLNLRSRDPYRAELRSLMADSALGGAWIALMKFNLLPSVLLVTMLSMDKLSVGGVRFLARCTLALLAACAVAGLATGFELRPDTSMVQILGSLGLLVAYPLAVGSATYSLARKVRDQNRLLAQLSRLDGLSRLLNRQHWEQEVAAEFQRSRRAGEPAALLMLDLDEFKAINDRYGHLAGDQVIRTVAATLGESLRGEDIVGRYGGEEFGIVLPQTGGERAEAIAERLRKRIESTVLDGAHGVHGTASIGIAELHPHDADHLEWIARADRALYSAKDQGRNRSVRFSPAV